MKLQSLSNKNTRKRFTRHIPEHRALKPLSHYQSPAGTHNFVFQTLGITENTYQIELTVEDIRTIINFASSTADRPPATVFYGILTGQNAFTQEPPR